MVHRDYRKELGLASPRKYVSRPVAIVVMVAVAAVVSFSATRIAAEAKKHHKAQTHASAPQSAPAAAPAQQ